MERKGEFAADLQMVDLGLRPMYSTFHGVTLRYNKLNSCNCIGERIQTLYFIYFIIYIIFYYYEINKIEFEYNIYFIIILIYNIY